MKTSTRQVDGVTVVDLSGRITLGEGSVVLRDQVRDAFDDQLCDDNKKEQFLNSLEATIATTEGT